MATDDDRVARAKARREELKKQAEALRSRPAGDHAAPDQAAAAAARKKAENERRLTAWSRGEDQMPLNRLGGTRPRSGWLATGRPDSGYMDRIVAGIRRLLGK